MAEHERRAPEGAETTPAIARAPTARPGAAFAAVDDGDPAELLGMMDATDAWPAVQAARTWVLEQAGIGRGAVVVDVGSGPGTFSAAAAAQGAVTADLDRSATMLAALRRRRPAAAAVRSDIGHLPVRAGAADLVHAERVLQWSDDPDRALAELRRVTAPHGCVAVTDTDWGSLVIDHPDPAAGARLAAGANRWIRHPHLARSVPRRLRALGADALEVRTDAVAITRWDPDDPADADGPPALPLRIFAAAAGSAADRARAAEDVDALAATARRGAFFATLTLVTTVARF